MLKFCKAHPTAIIPTKATEGAAGYDLYLPTNRCEVFLDHRLLTRIDIDIKMAIPRGYYGQIASRSSIAAKGVSCLGGVIDSDYRGSVTVVLSHAPLLHGPVIFGPGDRIAQLLILPIYTGESCVVTELDDTERGEGGFGSTGK